MRRQASSTSSSTSVPTITSTVAAVPCRLRNCRIRLRRRRFRTAYRIQANGNAAKASSQSTGVSGSGGAPRARPDAVATRSGSTTTSAGAPRPGKGQRELVALREREEHLIHREQSDQDATGFHQLSDPPVSWRPFFRLYYAALRLRRRRPEIVAAEVIRPRRVPPAPSGRRDAMAPDWSSGRCPARCRWRPCWP